RKPPGDRQGAPVNSGGEARMQGGTPAARSHYAPSDETGADAWHRHSGRAAPRLRVISADGSTEGVPPFLSGASSIVHVALWSKKSCLPKTRFSGSWRQSMSATCGPEGDPKGPSVRAARSQCRDSVSHYVHLRIRRD